MTFSADAVDHSMTCRGCKETRRALREGKLALRDRWRAEAATYRSVTDKPAGGPPRRDRHKPRPRRPAVNIATTAHPRSDKASHGSAAAGADAPEPPSAPEPAAAAQPQAKVVATPPESDTPRWTPPTIKTTAAPIDTSSASPAQPPSPVRRVAAERDRADDEVFPHLEIPDREPPARASIPEPVRPRPTGTLVSLPDRTPGRRNLAATQPDRKPAPQRAATQSRRAGTKGRRVGSQGRVAGVGTTILASITAVGSRVIPKLSGRYLVGAVGLLTIFGLGAVVVDSARTSATSQGQAAVPSVDDLTPTSADSSIRTGLAAGSALQGQSAVVSPEPTGIVATPEPPPTNPNDPTLATWQSLSLCEASGNWGMNSGNGFYGGLQFTVESWRMVGGTGLPHEAPAIEQIRRAERLLDLQGWVAWPVCSIRLGLRTAEPGEVLHPAAVPQVQPSDPVTDAEPITAEP